ncbi:hypothetical protein [Aeromicrobium sp. Root236]|uniref:hypothetical protein n=1 Tax=Aeromicrobium sp. Root236 TaxID=1736498 RepID=UPI000B13C837|nr:hypothetical protein [Aeromicrobium sp. Root236]
MQTTFLSVGFAGLAIAAQLFAEAPLAIGASRGRVLDYIWAGWFVGVGLVANAVIAIETIWLPSGLGVVGVALTWFSPTVVLLVLSTVRLMKLFGHPSLLDEVVRLSLVETLSSRLDSVSRKYADARKQLEGLVTSSPTFGSLKGSTVSLRVQVPQAGLVVKTIKPKILRRALDSLGPRATEDGPTSSEDADLYTPPEIALFIEPGDRTRPGETAFNVSTSQELDDAAQVELVRLLQSAIEFEVSGSVTPDEETDREIANLKDAIGTNLRTGAFATAERAMELLAQVVRGVWLAQLEGPDPSRRASFTRRDWLFRSIGEVEQDALLSPRAAGLFITQAMTRALEAPQAGSTEYVDECLRSFTRLWFDLLRYGGSEFESLPSRISTCVQNLAAYSYSAVDDREDLHVRATWAMVELVKLGLDARDVKAAKLAAEELSGLFEFADRHGSGRDHVRAGQLVLSGWMEYLADKNDERNPADPELRLLVTPRGNWSEILRARTLAERGVAPFSRWDWWEMTVSGSSRAQALQLSHYIDRAEVAALASSHGSLPPAEDQETASEYKRFLQLLSDAEHDLTAQEHLLKQKFMEEIEKWDHLEDAGLAEEPISADRVEALANAIRETMDTGQRLAALIPDVSDVPELADESVPILGMNFRVPKNYLVDKMFNQTYADPKDLGEIIARGFADGEERKIIDELRSLQGGLLDPSAQAIIDRINTLEDEAQHYILLTPYGGLMDIGGWYSAEFRDALARVTHIESAVLDREAILFDRRTTLASSRGPEEKEGLTPVGETSIALGVFEDVLGGDQPQVRVETGEYFVVWPGEAPRVFRFGVAQTVEQEPGGGNPDADSVG